MDKFQEMLSFATVVDAGSFVRAADILDTSKAAVSRHVADLEQRLGVRLLNRTTRKLSLTDDGQAFHHHCTEILAATDAAEIELTSRSAEASGLLRISVPVTFGIRHLAPLWGIFLDQNPKVTLDVSLADRTVDLVEDGFDLAVRISRSPHPTLIGRKLATTRMVLCASPIYLKRRGALKRPEDLSGHDTISYTYWSSKDEWKFDGPDGPVTVKTRPRIHTNSGDNCRAAALQHQGIVLQPDFLVADDLRSGALKEILPAWQAGELGIYAIYASRRQLPLKLRHMVDFLAESFQAPTWNR
ncbi:LysR family transcriptional regulator [soil metagenome]